MAFDRGFSFSPSQIRHPRLQFGTGGRRSHIHWTVKTKPRHGGAFFGAPASFIQRELAGAYGAYLGTQVVARSRRSQQPFAGTNRPDRNCLVTEERRTIRDTSAPL